ncbi:MAG: thiamine pyrophosphate-dependent dehydrogenase E1 component subunit alpha [Planctomycetota bacterium]|jgi:pyruvate dehydrogenase E1 component alpha subunit/2-oxoisovalerate dehydrogenase E1 component alpha subunit
MAKARIPAKKKAASKKAPAERDLGLLRVLKDNGSVDPKTDPKLGDERCIELYRQMLFLRHFDNKMLGLQRQGRIAFYGASMGQEAATVGSASVARPDDWVFPALREGGAALLRGMPLKTYIGQLYGNSADESMGHQQPMHFSWRAGNHVSLSSPIGTQIPQAAGAAMAANIRGDDVIVLGYMGDGATSEGDFHVGMNFAAVFKAPVVMICQNNGWAISVPVSMQTASETIAIKARAYGMPGVRVDGNDLLAVVAAVQEAADRARKGGGPTFIELVTYRRLGHSSSDDPSRYRDENEVKEWEKKDPLERFRRYLEKRGLWDETKEEAAVAAIGEEVEQAILDAEAAPPPPLESLIEHVVDGVPRNLRDQLDDVRPFFEEGGVADGAFPL